MCAAKGHNLACCAGLPDLRLAGVSLAPVLKDAAASPRQAALTQYASGYSIRTQRYRYTQWGSDGGDGAELYDHKTDPQELVNLADRQEYSATQEQLTQLLRKRVAQAGRAPKGVKQIRFENRRRVP